VGYTLDEIPNDITKSTPASFEPAIDYVVTKIPRFSFDKFPEGGNRLSPQMKSVGEVMAIGRTFKESFQKALRGLEVPIPSFETTLGMLSKTALIEELKSASSERVYWLLQALAQGFAIEEIHELTKIDPWFLHNINAVIKEEQQLKRLPGLASLTPEQLRRAKQHGLSDEAIAKALGVTALAVQEVRHTLGVFPIYKSVDTCAGEFHAETPYFYSTYDVGENEAPTPDPTQPNKRVVILGGGPNRIGQGIEFDYCCVHAAMVLKELGYEPIMVNSNPETVSTDYDISTRLYFEPLTAEDVHNLLRQEQPLGVIAQLGGQTPLKLARALRHDPYFSPLGTSVQAIDDAEDREKFRAILNELNLKAPESGIAHTHEEAITVGRTLGYPLMIRPSYVLGGRAMRVVYSEESLLRYLDEIMSVEPDAPVLLDRFLDNARELDVDAVSDGVTTYVGAILEHIEQAGIHSGDSACVWPAQHLSEAMKQEVTTATTKLAHAIGVKGLINIQFAVKNDELYVIEVNPRGSRTVPFVCKATGKPLMKIAVRVMLGEPLQAILDELQPCDPVGHVAVKEAVFPFIKFRETDPMLGPEMRSTGEVMGLDTTFPLAYAKALAGAGTHLPLQGSIFLSVNDTDKPHALATARKFTDLGFSILSTSGTVAYFKQHGIAAIEVKKKHQGEPNVQTLMEQGSIQIVINTPSDDKAMEDDSYIRKTAVLNNIPMSTTLTGAYAMAEAIEALRHGTPQAHALQDIFANKQTCTIR
jgi:carbamoyl-phosphate synthase large subunit